MATFKKNKVMLQGLLAREDWQAGLAALLSGPSAARCLVSPLLAFLAREEARWQAVWGLGVAVSLLAAESLEDARVVMRRLMWSMNEESGNLGWGIPEAMGSVMARHEGLAGEYSRILFSYMHETGRDDNYIDHAPLRRGVYWASGYVVQRLPLYAQQAMPGLLAALEDNDTLGKGFVFWAMLQCFRSVARHKATAPVGLAEPEALVAHNDALQIRRHLSVWREAAAPVRLLDENSIVSYSARQLADAVSGSMALV